MTGGEQTGRMSSDRAREYVYHARACRNAEAFGDTIVIVEPRGGATMVVERDGADDSWDVAVALCSPEDNFCRKSGVRIARTRMASQHEEKDVKNVVRVVADGPERAAMIGLYRVVNRQEPRTIAQRERWERKRRYYGSRVIPYLRRRVDEHDGTPPSPILRGE